MSLYFAPQREATFKDGCLAVRQSVLDKMRERTAPGPIYNPRQRVSSAERSLRNITFGTGPARYNDAPEHNKRRVPSSNHHPGPQTYDPDGIRRAILFQSKHRNVSGPKFGTGKRDCSNDDDDFVVSRRSSSATADSSKNGKSHRRRCWSPGPAEYDPAMIRRGLAFSKSGTTNDVRFGTARNDVGVKNAISPGPQTYDPEAIKRGILFTKSKTPSVSFGSLPNNTSRRRRRRGRRRKKPPSSSSSVAADDNASSDEDDDHLPGPQDYDTDNIRRGVYSLSTKRKPAGVRFTTGPRTYNDVEERERASKPGPGAYGIGGTMGPQANSKYRSQPRISFGAR